MEAEFIAASQAGRELLGMKALFDELKLNVIKPMSMWMDKQTAIEQIESEKSMSNAKHVDIKFKFISNYAKDGIVAPNLIKFQAMIADI
ncbi:unnamed protein product [Peronospora effusa]|nr:unnamed protein product [Peronospora effusa]